MVHSIINHKLGGGGEWRGYKDGFSSGPEKHPVFIFNQEISHHCYVTPKTERKIQSKQHNFHQCQINFNI